MQESVLMPNNPDLEGMLLGAILLENKLLHRMQSLQGEHFYQPIHQRIFDAITRLMDRGERADPITLRSEFENDPDLAEVGGGSYLIKLAGAGGIAYNATDYAVSVIALAKRRELILGCLEAVRTAAEDFSSQPEEIAAKVGRIADEVATAFDSMQTKDNFEVTEAILASMKENRDPIPTGIYALDDAMDGGLYPGRSYGFAARKKVGKTVLASTVSYNLNQQGIRHLFICGEMGPLEIHERCLARGLQVYPSDFRKERNSPAFQRLIADYALKQNRCVFYQNAPGLTFDALRRIVASAIHRRKISGFILDYWQLVGGKPKNRSTSEHLDEVAQWIADFCRQHGIWSMTMAQINQEGNTRGGEGIRLAFDQVYQLCRDDTTQPFAYMQMKDTRYTPWKDVGTKDDPWLIMNPQGPYFEMR